MISKYFLPFILLFLLTGCYTHRVISKIYPPLDFNHEVQVLDESQSIPSNSEEIGRLKIRELGHIYPDHEYGYNNIIEKAKIETQKAGGNVLKITKHKLPGFVAYYRLWAKILKVQTLNDPVFTESIDSSSNKANYALLNIYRFGFGGSILTGIDLHLGDSVICRIKPVSKQTIKLYKEGEVSLWVKKGKKFVMPINIKHGMQYYIRCTLLSVGPKLEIIDNKTGRMEFSSF